MTSTTPYAGKKNRWVQLGGLSLVAIAGLLILLEAVRPRVVSTKDELVVYCAAGIRLPVADAARDYTEAFGMPIRLEYGSSGDLEKRLESEAKYGKSRADLYIPANDFFAQKAAAEGLTLEHIPLAQFKLVLASKRGLDLQVTRLQDLLDQDLSFVMCNPEAAAGRFTQKTLTALGLFDALDKAKKASHPTVVEAANAVKVGPDIQAGFMWNTTARQFDLDIVTCPELDNALSSVSVNVVKTTPDPASALRFARYLSAPTKGNLDFTRYHFDPLAGDAWIEVPELTFFCGGVNKAAVEQTLQEFEVREGVQIRSQFAGCGALVGMMKGIKSGERQAGFPDAYMTCDKTYYDMVQGDFGPGKDVSTTSIVMLVRDGNPKGIKTLSDLARPEVYFGTTDPKMSTLGFLSWKILSETGLKEAVRDNVVVTTPTAHELVTQMASHPKLDAVLVYVANCRFVKETMELIPIDHPMARATQNIGTSVKTPYPLLTERLINAVHGTDVSKRRFLSSGFEWVADQERP